jgi:hypothetical protein
MPTTQDFKLAVRGRLADWIPTVVHAATAELAGASLRNAIATDRQHTADVLAVLQGRGEAVAAALVRAVQQGLDDAGRDGAQPAGRVEGVASLSLIAEEQIDEDIEIARIVQLIESEADAELRQLARLCSSLLGSGAIEADSLPLPPGLCARALSRSLDDFGLPRPARLLMLRHAGTALGRQLRQVYASQCELLTQWGVRPAQFSIRPAPAGVGSRRPAGPAAQAQDPPPGPAVASLARLVQWAQQRIDAAPQAAAAPTLRLLADPLPAGTAPRGLGPGTAMRVMEQLFDQLLRHSGISPAARELVQRLREPALHLAEREAGLWSSLDHPWWQLLDRFIALGTVHDQTDVSAALGRVVDTLRQARSVGHGACRSALAEVEQVSSRLLDERHGQLGAAVHAVQPLADRELVEVALRNQMVQQLRQTPVPAGLWQFLVGPWVLAMAEMALRHGTRSRNLDERATLVDDLVVACSRPSRPARAEQQRALLQRAREGLAAAAMMPARLEAELADLAAVLRDPSQALDEPAEGAADAAPADGFPDSDVGVPTVLIDTLEAGESSEAARDCQAWLDGLVPGEYCRMFLLGRWMTTQLTWVSGNRNLYVFSSRHAGRVHSLTRRALEKARGAGLAASVGDGLLLAQAMDTLTDAGEF